MDNPSVTLGGTGPGKERSANRFEDKRGRRQERREIGEYGADFRDVDASLPKVGVERRFELGAGDYTFGTVKVNISPSTFNFSLQTTPMEKVITVNKPLLELTAEFMSEPLLSELKNKMKEYANLEAIKLEQITFEGPVAEIGGGLSSRGASLKAGAQLTAVRVRLLLGEDTFVEAKLKAGLGVNYSAGSVMAKKGKEGEREVKELSVGAWEVRVGKRDVFHCVATRSDLPSGYSPATQAFLKKLASKHGFAVASVVSAPARGASASHTAVRASDVSQQPVEEAENQTNIEFMDICAQEICAQLSNDGSVAKLHADYKNEATHAGKNIEKRTAAFKKFATSVDIHCENEQKVAAWLNCGKSLAGLTQNIAVLTKSRSIQNFSIGVGALTQTISGVHAFQNSVRLMKHTTGAAFVESFSGMLNAAGMVVGAVSLVASLFSKKEARRPDYSAATYQAVLAMWQEMRQGFQAMQQDFETTWSKLDQMTDDLREGFNTLKRSIDENHHALSLGLNHLSFDMHNRFNHMDWRMRDLFRQLNAKEERGQLQNFFVKTTEGMMQGIKGTDDFLEKQIMFASLFGANGVQQEAFVGRRVSADSTSQAKLKHPAFNLLSLSSYLNNALAPKTLHYSRTQMARLVTHFAHPEVTAPMGIEHFTWAGSLSDKESLSAIFNALPQGKCRLIPVEMGGTWLLLEMDKTENPVIRLEGLRNAVENAYFFILSLELSMNIEKSFYPENIRSYQTGPYCAFLIESRTGKTKAAFDAETLKRYSEKVGLSSSDEQTLGNPLLDFWLVLQLKKLMIQHYDLKRGPLEASTLELMTKLIRGMSEQAQLFTRMQDPALFRKLLGDYAVALQSFDVNFKEVAQKIAQEVSNTENAAIKKRILEGLRDNAPTVGSNFGLGIECKVDYDGAKWWTGRGRAITYGRRGNVTKDVENGFDSQFAVEGKRIHLEKMTNERNRILNEKTRSLDVERAGNNITPAHRISEFLQDKTTFPELTKISFPSVMCSRDNNQSTLFLIAPQNIAEQLPLLFKQAYMLGLIQIQFSYAIERNNAFTIYIQWRANAQESWRDFAKTECAYDPLFYQGEEAIFWFWYGGNIPLNHLQTTEVVGSKRHNDGRGQAGTEYKNWRNDPIFGNRVGAINQAFKMAAIDNLDDKRNIQALLADWKTKVFNSYAEKLVQAMRNAESNLGKATAKMDQAYQLLNAYLNALEFGFQSEDFSREVRKALAENDYYSEVMLASLAAGSMQAFEARRPTRASLENLQKRIEGMLATLPAPSLGSPYSVASLTLLEELNKRLRGERNIKGRELLISLETILSNFRRDIAESFSETDDVTFKAALQEEQLKSGIHLNKIESENKREQEARDELINQQKRILNKLTLLSECFVRLENMRKEGLVDDKILVVFTERYKKMVALYNAIQERIAECNVEGTSSALLAWRPEVRTAVTEKGGTRNASVSPRSTSSENSWYDNEIIDELLQKLASEDMYIFSPLLGTGEGVNSLREIIVGELKKGDKCHRFMIPLNLNNSHWVLLHVTYSEAKTEIFYVDPRGQKISDELTVLLQGIFSNLQIISFEDRLQKDEHNCGPWIVEIAKVLAAHRSSLPELRCSLNELREVNIRQARQNQFESLSGSGFRAGQSSIFSAASSTRLQDVSEVHPPRTPSI